MDRSMIHSQYERVLHHIRDIHTAKVNLGSDGSVEEVHVLASGGRSVKQIIKDIQTALLSQFDAKLSPDRIRVTLIGSDLEPETGWGRPVFTTVEVVAQGTLSQVTVALRHQGATFRGEAQGPAYGSSHLRVVSEATLRAAGSYLQAGLEFQLEEVVLLPLGTVRAAVAAVNFVDHLGKVYTLTGSAPMRNDEREAVARATLDALNRQFMVKTAGSKKRREVGAT